MYVPRRFGGEPASIPIRVEEFFGAPAGPVLDLVQIIAPKALIFGRASFRYVRPSVVRRPSICPHSFWGP